MENNLDNRTIVTLLNDKTRTNIDQLDLKIYNSCKRYLTEQKWTFGIEQLIECNPWRKWNKTTIYADSIEAAMEELASIWNNGGNPDDDENSGEEEDNYFLDEIIDNSFDKEDNPIKITPKELQKIIFETGCHSAEPFFTGRQDSSSVADHTKIYVDMPDRFRKELGNLYMEKSYLKF